MTTFSFDSDAWLGLQSPQHISLGNLDAWVSFESLDGTVSDVLLDKCAHMGSRLKATKGGFLCPSHLWSYDKSGKNEALHNPDLESLEFSQTGSKLDVFLEDYPVILPADGSELDGTESLELISHATYFLKARGVKLLFDPWIVGTTYWGTWGLYPEYGFQIDDLEAPSHVIITHPHPDHFHPETLAYFDRRTKIYIPPFQSEIMPRVLERMGFTNVVEVDWEKRVDLGANVSFSFLRPNTVWEDAAVLVRVADWLWLNQNDSGTPLKDAAVPYGIDLLSSTFDDGASGYPITWDMPIPKREKILSSARAQILESLRERCEQTGAKYFSPFAGWWRHRLAAHDVYASQLNHITLDDLEIVFQGEGTDLIPSIPSTKINLREMTYERSNLAVKALGDEVTKSVTVPATSMEKRKLGAKLRKKLGELAKMSRATNCENVDFEVEVRGIDLTILTRFGSGEAPAEVSVKVTIEPWVAELYADGDETVTWNHLDIGYLGNWSRTPDVYPVKFMKLLQLGYVESFTQGERLPDDVMSLPLATILESDPRLFSRVFGRAGLPCVSCKMTKSETLGDAANVHRLTKQAIDSLANEIAAAMPRIGTEG